MNIAFISGTRDAESVAMLEMISETGYLSRVIAYDRIDSVELTLNTELDAGRAGGIASLIKTLDAFKAME